MSTRKWRGANDDDLKTMVVILQYLSRDMAKAVSTEGVANPEGPTDGEMVEAPTCPILLVYDLSKLSPAAVLQNGIGCLDRMRSIDTTTHLAGIPAIVICNLKSYAGERNPWEKPSASSGQKGWF